MRNEVSYQDFAQAWAKAVSTKDPVAMLTMNLSVSVRCRNCRSLVNGEDSVRGSELYCPKCGAAWVVRSK